MSSGVCSTGCVGVAFVRYPVVRVIAALPGARRLRRAVL